MTNWQCIVPGWIFILESGYIQILSSPSAEVVDGVEDDKFLEKLWVWLQVLVVAEVIGD